MKRELKMIITFNIMKTILFNWYERSGRDKALK